MASDRHEIQVGIALVVSVVVLIAGLLWFEEYRFDQDHVEIRATFPSAGGLGVGDPVHVRGIPMGQVSAIDLGHGGIVVSMDVDRNVVLTDQSKFFLGSRGLVGERLIDIEPGMGKPLSAEQASEQTFEGDYHLALSELAGRFDALNENLLAFLERVTKLIGEVEDSGGIGAMVEETTQAARTANRVLEENANNLRRASESVAEVSENVERLLDQHGEKLGEGMDNLASAGAKMDSLLVRLQSVAEGTDDIVNAIRDQEGALGKLIYDEKMRADIEESVATLRRLLEDILANPQRYLKIEIF